MSERRPTILTIEDEPQMRCFLRALIDSRDYAVLEAETAHEGLSLASDHRPDLIVLDLGLPDVDGLTLVSKLREWTQTPIIVVSARGREQDKVRALDLGADDYLTKPFGSHELLARIRVALRHATRITDQPEPLFRCKGLVVDLVARKVTYEGEPLHLTPVEYKLLSMLIQHAGKVLTHRQLLEGVWGPKHLEDTHYLRVYMAQLRRKLEGDPARPRLIKTETGIGYRLEVE